MLNLEPSYLKLLESSEFNNRIKELYKILESCKLCPRKCGINRFENQRGYCGAGKELLISSYFPHFGEESVLSGRNGSGTIFLTWCNLKCAYCQNYTISHLGEGRKVSEKDCAQMMLELQSQECHNINFVTPTHFSPQIIKTIKVAAENGLYLPIVWNCSGYENVKVIKLLDGIVDIYMPDFKYGNKEAAAKYSKAHDYFERAKEAIKEMHRQVGDLILDENGIAQRGLLVRHLVLPNNMAGTKNIVDFLAKEISKNTFLNIMSQYRPCFKAKEFPEINRSVTKQEYLKAVQMAKEVGITRLYS